ncbi:MAG: rRNA maturation RNase YbeY [Pseudomonadota bacterium]
MPHDIDILIEDPRWRQAEFETLAKTAITATLDDHGISAATVSVLACDDTRIATLNSDFRDKPTPTNVLSWPEEALGADEAGAAPRKPQPDPDDTLSLGDIAIAYDTCAREASEQGKPFSAHVTHLLVHGTLHLLGYDHIRDPDATRMETLEVEILGKLGLPDPYWDP